MLISVQFEACKMEHILSRTRPFRIFVIGLLDLDQQYSRNFCIFMKDNLITMNCVVLLIKWVVNFHVQPVFE